LPYYEQPAVVVRLLGVRSMLVAAGLQAVALPLAALRQRLAQVRELLQSAAKRQFGLVRIAALLFRLEL
jgi:hypothetical protein